MTTAINASATSEQVREQTRELTEDELEHISGGKLSVATPTPGPVPPNPAGPIPLPYPNSQIL
jgi:bacteriocin-like protein